MSAEEQPEEPSAHIDKGKRRAHEPTERTPLLGATSSVLDDAVAPQNSSHRGLRSQLTAVFLISLTICILGFVLVALLAWSYASRASNLKPDDVIKNDVVFRGPDKIDVLNVTEDRTLWLNVRGRVGVNAGSAIGVDSDDDDGLFRDIWKTIGRWGVRTLDRVTVNLTSIKITPEYDPTMVLVTLDIPPLELPLSVDPPNDVSWLTPISTPVRVQLSANNTLLLQFLKESWKLGALSVQADVGQAFIRGGSLDVDNWRSNFRAKLSNIRTDIRMKMPSIPGFPHPGRNVPMPALSQFVTLKSFNVSSESHKLNLHATATVLNPAPPHVHFSVPSLPFIISICDKTAISLAAVSTAPFSLTKPNITLSMSGDVLPISTSSFSVLSRFVSRYLSGEPNTVLISSPLIEGLEVEAEFPAPNPRPQLLRDVTIRDMKIRPTGTMFLASGTVEGRVVLPSGINVGLDIFRVFPDVIIFDGELPSSMLHKGHNSSDLPPEVPLPDPLPEHAFGHIRPDDWLVSVSVPVEPEEGDGTSYEISAKVVDAPVEVLPGRQKQFSNFVGKVIFGSEGATAGISGFAAVTVAVDGLPLHGPGRKSGEVVLSGLPFQGNVHVGKKSLFMGETRELQQVMDRLKHYIPW
ncbi:hypothetical protein GALMADRAFT_119991 [Galerina marginata CBS 339.88]|uniref:Uncharacterized protein n=1 Tax=Galerina marginata (strain CBS 339.88) TaxID=685588 RepID=A0A067T1G8_GALM3|nr:hypothetical protein GALMADRAFT_119991 [Galerina marginata CBS 339.88]